MRAPALFALCGCAAPAEVGWDPATGRGAIALRTPAGDRVEIHLQDGFEGYTGGLLLGSMGGSAYRRWPAGAGPEGVAHWCAQDESLWLQTEGGGREYAHGWSENFGSGADGVPLRYLGGAILGSGPEGTLLRAENAAWPFHLVRWLLVRPDGALLTRLRVANAGDIPLRFSFWEGEDPWVGAWGDSAGDLGWTGAPGGPGRWQRTEGAVVWEGCVGIGDPGEGDGGPPSGSYLCLGPGAPAPDSALFARRFVHAAAETDPTRPLGAEGAAFNLGWTGNALGPGEAWELTFALGAADPPRAGQGPRAPAIPASAWDLLAAEPVPPPAVSRDPLRFAAETVDLTVLPGGGEVEVRGRYTFANDGDEDAERRIFFPFHVDADHPWPTSVDVGGRPLRRLRDGVVFAVRVPARGADIVELAYRQRSPARSAVYVVTTANAWDRPLAEAALGLHLAPDVTLLSTSLPLEDRSEDGRHLGARFAPFTPDREWEVLWRASDTR